MSNAARIVPLLVSLVLVAGCEAVGEVPERQWPQAANADCERLAPLVSNPDGSLSHAEFESALKFEFKKWDKDGSGSLNSSELQPLNDYLRALNAGASPVMDWNGDGHVSFAEYAGGWRTMFELCGNGEVVTKADMVRSPRVTPPVSPAGGGDSASARSTADGHGL